MPWWQLSASWHGGGLPVLLAGQAMCVAKLYAIVATGTVPGGGHAFVVRVFGRDL